MKRPNSAAALLFTGLMACGEAGEKPSGEEWDDCAPQVQAAEGYVRRNDWIGNHSEQIEELLMLKSAVQKCLVEMGISPEKAHRLIVTASQTSYVSMPTCTWEFR